jgi:hypothetical protein
MMSEGLDAFFQVFFKFLIIDSLIERVGKEFEIENFEIHPTFD